MANIQTTCTLYVMVDVSYKLCLSKIFLFWKCRYLKFKVYLKGYKAHQIQLTAITTLF